MGTGAEQMPVDGVQVPGASHSAASGHTLPKHRSAMFRRTIGAEGLSLARWVVHTHTCAWWHHMSAHARARVVVMPSLICVPVHTDHICVP